MKHKAKGQVIVYVVMRQPQANITEANRVYFSERRAKNYCKKRNADIENFTGYHFQKRSVEL